MTTRTAPPTYRYLNRDGLWEDFAWIGLDRRDDGRLELASLPSAPGNVPDLRELREPDGPAGIAEDPAGTMFLTDPAQDRLLRIDGCDSRAVSCTAAPGGEHLRLPRGLLLDQRRETVRIADSGNDRVLTVDAASLQLLEILGPQIDRWRGAALTPANLRAPSSLAQDGEGHLYVVDAGNHRVLKFDWLGYADPAFTLASSASLAAPVEIASALRGNQTELYVLDGASRSVVVLNTGGQAQRTLPLAFEKPLGVVASEDGVIVGDNASRRIFRVAHDGTVLGPAAGYEGPVAAMASAARDRLLVHPGSVSADGECQAVFAPLVLARRGARVRRGFLWTRRALKNPSLRSDPEQWHRVTLDADVPPEGAHLRIHVHASAATSPPPPPTADAGFSAPWEAVGMDAPGCLVAGWKEQPSSAPSPGSDVENGRRDPLNYLNLGVELTSEGLRSATLSQIRVTFDHETYVQFLPSVFREDRESRRLLSKLLTIYESLFDQVGAHIENLPALFDPEAAPAEALPWLAGWLGVELDGRLDDASRRDLIARAFERHGRRGTPEGMREWIRAVLGCEVHVDEPALHASWWRLPDESGATGGGLSLLGLTTRAVAASPQGAVVGTSAVLDQSHLISGEQYGSPLFEGVAHQFLVRLYRGARFSEGFRERIEALIEREAPAHTTWHVCVVEPQSRVGVQARVGVDTIVGGATPEARLDRGSASGAAALVLSGEGRRAVGLAVGHRNTLPSPNDRGREEERHARY